MRKKFLTALAAGAAAIAGGLVSSPSGQQLMEQAASQAQGQQVTAQAPQRYNNNSQQQAQNRLPVQTVQQYLSNPYAPMGGGRYYGNGYGMSPKEYGEYLMRTGKDKYNKRKRKHIAKGFA